MSILSVYFKPHVYISIYLYLRLIFLFLVVLVLLDLIVIFIYWVAINKQKMKLPPKHEQKSEYDDNKHTNDANKNDQNSDHFITYNKTNIRGYLIDN